MQMQGSSLGQADTGSVALPAVLRAGKIGPAWFSVGSVQPAKFSSTSHQAHTGHMASTVSDMLHSNVFFVNVLIIVMSVKSCFPLHANYCILKLQDLSFAT